MLCVFSIVSLARLPSCSQNASHHLHQQQRPVLEELEDVNLERHQHHSHNHSGLMSPGSGALLRCFTENLNAFSPRSPTERPLKWWWEDKLTQHKRWLIIFLSDDWALIIPLISLILNDLIKTIQTLTQSPRWRRDVASNRQQPKVQRRLQSQRKAANEAGAGKDYPDPNALCILICALKPSTLEKRNSSRLVLHL